MLYLGPIDEVVSTPWVRLMYFARRMTALEDLTVNSTVAGEGPTTVVLVHGYTCDETTWMNQVPELAHNCRVITLDLPGHGRSSLPALEQFSMSLFARAVEVVRAEVDAERIVLVGHSMGTLVILEYARMYPENVSGLVFVDGLMPGRPDQRASTHLAPAEALRSAALRMGGVNGYRNRLAMICRFFGPSTAPTVRRKVLAMMLAAPEITAVGAMYATLATTASATYEPVVPIRGIYADPPIASRDAVLRYFPKAQLAEVRGTGHFLMLEKPTEFNDLLLRCLKSLP